MYPVHDVFRGLGLSIHYCQTGRATRNLNPAARSLGPAGGCATAGRPRSGQVGGDSLAAVRRPPWFLLLRRPTLAEYQYHPCQGQAEATRK
jgi:hypothetical protein